jgi:hypothetical protein
MIYVPEPLHLPSLPVARLAAADGLTSSAAASTQTEQDETVACSGRVGASQLKRRRRATALSASCGMSALHADAAHRDLGSSPTWPARKCVGRLLVGLSRLSSASRRSPRSVRRCSELRRQAHGNSSFNEGHHVHC